MLLLLDILWHKKTSPRVNRYLTNSWAKNEPKICLAYNIYFQAFLHSRFHRQVLQNFNSKCPTWIVNINKGTHLAMFDIHVGNSGKNRLPLCKQWLHLIYVGSSTDAFVSNFQYRKKMLLNFNQNLYCIINYFLICFLI